MEEAEWLASSDPAAMLSPDGDPRPLCYNLASDRKLRLFACAVCRQVWHRLTDWERQPMKLYPGCGGTGRVNPSQRAVEVAERYVDGEATLEDMMEARRQ